MVNKRNRTPSSNIGYGLYLYFLGLSTRSVAKALSFLYIIKRSHVSIWNWIQKHHPKKIVSKRKRISEFVVDETAIKVSYELIWLWVAIEPKNMRILALTISKERNICLWLNAFYLALSKITENTQFLPMVERGIHRLADS